MKRFILLSLILLNVLGGQAQESSRKWMVIKPDTANEQETRPIPTVYDVVAEANGVLFGRNQNTVTRSSRENTLFFQKAEFKDYEEYLCKTYKLYAQKSGKFTTGQLDFYPTKGELFMRLIWDDAKEQYEIYRIDINRYGLSFDTYFYGTMEKACSTPPEQWTKMTTRYNMFSVKGDSTGFYNGNALFIEDTSIPAKDVSAIRQSLELKKNMLDSLFATTEIIVPHNNNEDEDRIYVIVEENPRFPGGEEACMLWLAENIVYPETCVEQGIQGRVYAQFVIEKDGSLTNIKIVRSPHQDLSEEAIRVLADMPKWKPGIQRGKPVRAKYSLPVYFRLSVPKATKGKP